MRFSSLASSNNGKLHPYQRRKEIERGKIEREMRNGRLGAEIRALTYQLEKMEGKLGAPSTKERGNIGQVVGQQFGQPLA